MKMHIRSNKHKINLLELHVLQKPSLKVCFPEENNYYQELTVFRLFSTLFLLKHTAILAKKCKNNTLAN